MDWEKIELLQKAIEPERPHDTAALLQANLCDADGEPNDFAINMLTGQTVSGIVDAMLEEEVEVTPILSSLKDMIDKEDYMGVYFMLLYLFSALEMAPPKLYLQLSANTSVMRRYLREFYADLVDCATDN